MHINILCYVIHIYSGASSTVNRILKYKAIEQNKPVYNNYI